MKHLLLSFIFVLFSLVANAQNKSILGAWVVSTTTQSQCLDAKDNKSTPCPTDILKLCWTIIFEADGTFKYLNKGEEEIGTYAVEGKVIKLKTKKSGNAHFILSGDTITYTLPDTGEACKTVFTFKKS